MIYIDKTCGLALAGRCGRRCLYNCNAETADLDRFQQKFYKPHDNDFAILKIFFILSDVLDLLTHYRITKINAYG